MVPHIRIFFHNVVCNSFMLKEDTVCQVKEQNLLLSTITNTIIEVRVVTLLEFIYNFRKPCSRVNNFKTQFFLTTLRDLEVKSEKDFITMPSYLTVNVYIDSRFLIIRI